MSNTLKDSIAKAANAVHRNVLNLSGGRIGGKIGSMPVVQLETTGRKSGQKRTVMLTSPVQRGDDVVLVASYGGDEKHPAWYLNLTDNPQVSLTLAGETFTATARTADAAERAELWPQITGAYKGYAGYQTRTDREIPVVICTRS